MVGSPKGAVKRRVLMDVTRGVPAAPCLVLIMTTPKAALDPYTAAVAASFRAVMDSTSFGLRERRFPSLPSIRISGEELDPCPMVPPPRILMLKLLFNSPPSPEV